MNKRVRIIVRGMVQGVCYRMYAREEALRSGLKGWVRNMADGSVEIVAEGDAENLVHFVNWCGTGSPYSRVSGVEDEYSGATGEFSTFLIRQDHGA